jgi:glycosyltransferase involved in cell wall biosynthesis
MAPRSLNCRSPPRFDPAKHLLDGSACVDPCGLPVAIAEPVNISAEVRVARAGLVHADTAAGTTEALRRWLALPTQEREQMGLRAAELFNEQFDFASMAKNLMPLLTDTQNN